MPNRKINYYNLSLHSGADVWQRLADVGEWLNEQKQNRTPDRLITTANESLALVTHFHLRYENTYNCVMKLIREEFPEVINKLDDTIEELEAEGDPDKGIYEETHFVIYNRPNGQYPVMAVESVMRGAKTKDILQFIDTAMVKAGFDGDNMRLDPVFAFQYENFEERIEDVAQLKVMIHHADIAGFSGYLPDAGELMRNAQEFADSEFVTLEFKINFNRVQTRHRTRSLRQRVLEFIGILEAQPEAKEFLKKLDVRAEDNHANGKVRLFDLIEEKVASEITVDKKRPTSQYYLSNDMYNAIRQRIIQDFRDEDPPAAAGGPVPVPAANV